MSVPSVAVIILTYNEEANIAQALDSVVGWARQIFILDSFSTDRTLEIAGRYPCVIHQNRFDNFAKQRNFALEQLPIETEWVFFLDADEWLPDDLKAGNCRGSCWQSRREWFLYQTAVDLDGEMDQARLLSDLDFAPLSTWSGTL